jgi:hypothetical protein
MVLNCLIKYFRKILNRVDRKSISKEKNKNLSLLASGAKAARATRLPDFTDGPVTFQA